MPLRCGDARKKVKKTGILYLGLRQQTLQLFILPLVLLHSSKQAVQFVLGGRWTVRGIAAAPGRA